MEILTISSSGDITETASDQNIAADSRSSLREATDQQDQKPKGSHHEKRYIETAKHDIAKLPNVHEPKTSRSTSKPNYNKSKDTRISMTQRFQNSQKAESAVKTQRASEAVTTQK